MSDSHVSSRSRTRINQAEQGRLCKIFSLPIFPHVPLEQLEGLWATKSEGVGVGLIDSAISFQDFQPM